MPPAVAQSMKQEVGHRVGLVARAPGVLAGLGVDPDGPAGAAGLDPAVLADPEGRISFAAMGRYFEACIAATGCPHFGLLVGRHGSLEDLGLVGRLMRHAPSAAAAVLDLAEAQGRYTRGAVVFVQRSGDDVHFGYCLHEAETPAREPICIAGMALARNMVAELGGGAPVRVLVAGAPDPRTRAAYEAFFGPLSYNATMWALVYPAARLARPNPLADPVERRRLEEEVRRYRAIRDPDTAERVMRALVPRACAGMDMSLAATARRLGIGPRTLQRRLRDCGTDFARLRNAARQEMAGQLLDATTLGVGEISASLGYAEPSVFTRAFRKWSGHSPAAWRNRVRVDRGPRPAGESSLAP